jgi:hypothetical protein
MSFKPKFNTPSAAAKPQAGKKDWSNKPFFLLKCKGADGSSTLLAFMREQDGQFGKYMAGNELILDDDGRSTKDAEGKTATTGSKFYFDAKSCKLKMKVGNETSIICELKASDKFPGCFYGTDEEGNKFYLDEPKKK